MDNMAGEKGNGQGELVGLIAGIAAGDRVAFRSLYDRTSGQLFATVRRVLVTQTSAEVALQDAYVRIWRRAGDFDAGISSPIAWMTTIARHGAVDIVRRGQRVSAFAKTPDAGLAERLADPAGAAPASGGRALASCLEKIEADCRSMVLLAYCYGWSREELSARFARPVATVKAMLRSGLILLKECLTP